MLIRAVLAGELDQLERPDIALEIVEVGPWKPGHFVSVWRSLYERGTGHCLGLFDGERLAGALGWIEHANPFSGEQVALEVMWYVDKALRGSGWAARMLDVLEAYCGAHRLHLMMPEPATDQRGAFERLYVHRKYKPVERFWIKMTGGQ